MAKGGRLLGFGGLLWLVMWFGGGLDFKKAYGSETPAFPLKTQGRWIVDQKGKRIKLKAVNWYGAHLSDEVLGGLDQKPLRHIVNLIKTWGFNTIRLPFSNQMLHRRDVVPQRLVAANPELFGKTPLEILDHVIDVLSDEKLMVVLNNHTTSSEWCCGFDHNGLWFTEGGPFPQSQSQWEADWLMMADRYARREWVIAADLRNEVRTGRTENIGMPSVPQWGQGGALDWYEMSRTAAQRLLEKGSPWLFVIEAINWEGWLPVLGSGRRPQLRPIGELPLQLTRSHRIVYGVHTYSYTGPEHTGDDRTSAGRSRYQDFDREELFRLYDEEFGFVVKQNEFFSAPVWVSEFGIARGTTAWLPWKGPVASNGVTNPVTNSVTNLSTALAPEAKWFAHLVEYMLAQDFDFAYWPLNPDGYGLVSEDWAHILDDDWRYPILRKLLDAPAQEPRPTEARWTLLDLRRGDFRGDHDPSQGEEPEDWLPGATKAACRADERLVGLSENLRGLCRGEGMNPGEETDPWHLSRREATVVAVDESYGNGHAAHDWATGMTKYECPLGQVVTGLTKHWWGLSGVRCQRPVGLKGLGSCQTLWFDRQDMRLSPVLGGDFARGSYKGQCHPHDYVAGVAHRDGTPKALLCCSPELG